MNTDIVKISVMRTTKKGEYIAERRFPIWEFIAYKGGEVEYVRYVIERLQKSLDAQQEIRK